MQHKRMSASFLRSFVFGVEDSIVSTVGLMSGIALAGVSVPTIVLTGFVYTFVEAFSMAAGAFLSERSAEEFLKQSSVAPEEALLASGIMFFSYLASGFIPILPYVFLGAYAFPASISMSLVALFILGSVGARISSTPTLSRGMQMLTVGGVAILLGVLAGYIGTALGVRV